MMANDIVTGLLAIIIGYLLGSIPSAYIVTRLVKGKDIRQLGGGNVGGLNVFREVGPWPALAVGIFDLVKGAMAVAIAYWLLALLPLFVMLAGLAAVVGHNWMVFLKFSGGKGGHRSGGSPFYYLAGHTLRNRYHHGGQPGAGGSDKIHAHRQSCSS